MKTYVAKTAGFCFGVANAIKTVYNMCETQKLVTYGPLIHNAIVTDQLAEKGVRVIDNFEGITDETVVIRSHGVPANVYDELKARNIVFIDCTCPHVKRIHRLAEQSEKDGRKLIIIGDKNHPEVVGIMGYATDCIVLKDFEETRNVNLDSRLTYTLVVQTTYNYEDFKKIRGYLCDLNLDIQIKSTICKATAERQAEAEQLAKIVDIMIVLGDPSSSNTDKLYRISKQYCNRTYRVETIHNLLLNNFKYDDKMGITAGASTPPAITEEAVTFMSELENSNNQSFAEMLDESIVTLHTGDVVKGRVIQIQPGEVSVNLNYKYEGILPRNEITDDPTVDISEILKQGQEIDVFVVRVNDGDGNVQVSKKRLDAQKNFVELEKAFNEKEVVKGKVIDQVKGGLIAIIKDMRVFVPSSQISNRFVEDLSIFKGKELNFNILELDKTKRRIVAGRKELAAIEQNQIKEEFFAKTKIGDKIHGTVSRIAAFGAFVDLGGVDGLIHVSELSWGRVRNVSDVLKEGEEIVVTVLDLDKEKGKISLSLKDIDGNPWNNAAEKFTVGTIVEGKVVRLVPFGAFVELEPGLDGLVHISQISEKHVAKAEDELSIGEIIKVKVMDVNQENRKISLSKKEADGALYTQTDAVESESFDPEIVPQVETEPVELPVEAPIAPPPELSPEEPALE
ncbi:MAG: bifunctional 4-hydroxy-3-methylbut-2-enyl diphosphate reductase/30S ribosomal protein S1 [Clostridiales bacterium]|jgi:4-hydroxy-3-methylbut-2-enyl diphosphate reductase|nr:bifunctional 4-hydroxy-3-methylbut-2-enyl diphosphate reductase/30S ribosomal protein S1 [Clostridiales bacterium]